MTVWQSDEKRGNSLAGVTEASLAGMQNAVTRPGKSAAFRNAFINQCRPGINKAGTGGASGSWRCASTPEMRQPVLDATEWSACFASVRQCLELTGWWYLWCRSWRASSEQLQWQVADLQRKLKDSEQRSTLWARRAGAAEARVPVQATSAKTALPRGPYPKGPALAQTDRVNLMGRSDSAVGGSRGADGNVENSKGTLLAEQQDHEDGCALALLQAALSAAPDGNHESAHGIPAARQAGMQYTGQPLQPLGLSVSDDAYMQSGQGQHPDVQTSVQPCSLKQRIAEYQLQNGLAAVPEQHASSPLAEEVLGWLSEEPSPLKQRIAEYREVLEQQLSSSTFTEFPGAFASRGGTLEGPGV